MRNIRPFTEYHGNLWWRDEKEGGRMKQIFINDRNGIFIHAAELAKGKKEVKLQLVISHYDKNAYNDDNQYEWYDFKDGEFVKDKSKYD